MNELSCKNCGHMQSVMCMEILECSCSHPDITKGRDEAAVIYYSEDGCGIPKFLNMPKWCPLKK